MKKKIIGLLCIAFASILKTLHADVTPTQPSQESLRLDCKVSHNNVPPTANFPVWLDVSITNEASTPFKGYYSLSPDCGMSVTTSSVQNPAVTVQRGSLLSGFATSLVLGHKETKHFHVLLNELVPVAHTGTLSCQITFPINERSSHGYLGLTLSTPLVVVVGLPLTPDQMQAVSKTFVAELEGTDQKRRTDAEREIKVLPDNYAVPILIQVTKDIPFAPWAIDSLGTRPRTQDTTDALQDLTQSSNADTRSVAKTYLAQNQLPQ